MQISLNGKAVLNMFKEIHEPSAGWFEVRTINMFVQERRFLWATIFLLVILSP
jgi:hypothetical protein